MTGDAAAAGTSRAAGEGAWVLDLDGVVWLAGEPIPGAGTAVARLRDVGSRVLFASNNSALTVTEIRRRLGRAGIEAADEDVVTSSQAAASLLEPGSTALVVGEQGILDALGARGVRVLPRGASEGHRPDTVVVGWTHRFDFDLLARASAEVRAGARLVGTNDDATFPTPDGLLPGAGSLLAAVATASGAVPEIAGKPHPPMARLIEARAGAVSVVVGDRPSTDGELARHLGAAFALVLTGVTSRADDSARHGADLVADDLAGVVAAWRG